jgi:hypothetical protein
VSDGGMVAKLKIIRKKVNYTQMGWTLERINDIRTLKSFTKCNTNDRFVGHQERDYVR